MEYVKDHRLAFYQQKFKNVKPYNPFEDSQKDEQILEKSFSVSEHNKSNFSEDLDVYLNLKKKKEPKPEMSNKKLDKIVEEEEPQEEPNEAPIEQDKNKEDQKEEDQKPE